MKKFIKYLGMVIVFVVSVGIVWHRFSNPDMTEIRWLIEFWYIWLGWFILTIVGYSLYLFGNGEICPTKRAPDGGGLARFMDEFFRPRR